MKKLFCLLLTLILANCEIKPRSASASESYNVACSTHSAYCVGMDTFTKNGMEYMVVSMNSGYTSPFVINLTKDKLEIELMRAQLLNELKQK